MTIEGQVTIWNVTATEDMSGAGVPFKAVSIAGTIAAGPSLAIGIARGRCPLGGHMPVVVHGITKAYAGGAVSTVGYPLSVAANSGWLVAASSGGQHVGRALTTAASGDLIPVMVDFSTKPAWAGL